MLSKAGLRLSSAARQAPLFLGTHIRTSHGTRSVHMNAAGASVVADSETAKDPIVQYVVVRKDLWQEQGWPLGPVIAQACHASIAALWLFKDDPECQEYVDAGQIDSMHKVVLECNGETQLRNLRDKLLAAEVPHKLWVEQPEDYPTALATKPCRKSAVAQHFKKFKLCKGKVA